MFHFVLSGPGFRTCAGFPAFEIIMTMLKSDQLMQELETHVKRIIEHPTGQYLNVTDSRAGVVKALTSFIDERIEARITRLLQDQRQSAQDQARRADPKRRPEG
jgi:hypothetical protein